MRRCFSAGGREELGYFAIEGTRLLERAVRAQAPLASVLMSTSYANKTSERESELLAALQKSPDLEVLILPDATIQELTGGRTYGDILALVRRSEALPLADCLARDSSTFRPGIVCVVDAEDPGNVGALVRTALVSGSQAFVAVGKTDPYHPKAVRTSMGSLFRLPILHFESPEALLGELSRQDVLSVGAVSQGGVPLGKLEINDQAIALFLGSEAFGLSEALVEGLDACITIPMAKGVDSLSINAAAAVCLYALLVK
ncbi:MAG: TrmH family RNA methyltransferase [Planctomycetota bacterium]|jgi:TrmH family RNA methyltransferase